MAKTSASHPGEPADGIQYPPEILAIRAALADVHSLQALIADNSALAQEQARILENRLFNADLRDPKETAELATLHTSAALCEQRNALLEGELEKRLSGLRARNINAKGILCSAANKVAEGRSQKEFQEKDIRDENDKKTIRAHHALLSAQCARLACEEAPRFAVETARQMLNVAAGIYAELPDYEAFAGTR